MTLAERFLALTPQQKRAVHFSLGDYALTMWNAYARSHGRMSYAEMVCGTSQVVDPTLPDDALASAKQGRDLAKVEDRYAEPIAALQDKDLKFPSSVEFAYYSIYNLFLKYTSLENIDDWLIVNQALSAESDATKWTLILEAAMNKAQTCPINPGSTS